MSLREIVFSVCSTGGKREGHGENPAGVGEGPGLLQGQTGAPLPENLRSGRVLVTGADQAVLNTRPSYPKYLVVRSSRPKNQTKLSKISSSKTKLS